MLAFEGSQQAGHCSRICDLAQSPGRSVLEPILAILNENLQKFVDGARVPDLAQSLCC